MTMQNVERMHNFGPAILSVTIPHAAFGEGPDGEKWMYVVANGNPAVFSVVDVMTGQKTASFLLENAEYSWGLTVDPYGSVYAGTGKGGLFRYVPGRDHVEALGIPDGETHLWRIASDEAGRIYAGTYPGGKVVRFDPSTNTYTDYGQLAEGEKYVRAVAYGSGKVYGGTGAVRARLFEIDPVTSVVSEIPLPEKYAGQKEVYDLNVHGNLLFARVTHFSKSSPLHNVTLVYDLASREWVEEWEGTPGFDVSAPDEWNNVYFQQNNRLMKYHLDSRELSSTGLDITAMESTRGFAWLALDTPEFPGKSLVSSNMRGAYLIYNPATGRGEVRQGKPQGAPVNIHSLNKAHDEYIYIGGYLAPSAMARFHTKKLKLETLPGMSQIEGMGTFQDKIYMGTYPYAVLHEFDPGQPWEPGVNPRKLSYPGTEFEQDRTVAFVTCGDKLAIGSIPVAGRLGGALCLCDPGRSHYEMKRHVVQDQSVLCLEYREGLLYGGTAIFGGYGSTPTAQEGKLFIWDMAQDKKIWEGSPVPGEYSVTALRFDGGGLLWGMTNSCLFTFDPAKRQVVKTERLAPYRLPEIDLGRNVLRFFKDGYLYGTMKGEIFRMNPLTWEKETIEKGTSYLAQDDDGHLYFVKNRTDFHRLPYPAMFNTQQV